MKTYLTDESNFLTLHAAFRAPTPLHRKNRTNVSKKQAIYFLRKIRQICHYESVQEQLCTSTSTRVQEQL